MEEPLEGEAGPDAELPQEEGLPFTEEAMEGEAEEPGGDMPFAEEPLEEIEEEFIPGQIPAVIDRPLGIDEGELIEVRRFVLRGARDLPAYGISVAEIEKQVESLRLARPQGFTIGRLQELAEQVTRYYRDRSLILAQAVVPVQQVTDGEVVIDVLEGRLGRVLVEGNKLYKEPTLQAPFRHLVGEPVDVQTVESGLLSLTDLPGLTVFGLFQPGQLVGTADLVLKVQDEQRLATTVRVDQHGTAETGRLRTRALVGLNNPTSNGDYLEVVAQQTFNPRQQFLLRGEYRRPLGQGFYAGGNLERNRFTVAQPGGNDIESITTIEGLYLGRQFFRSRKWNLAMEWSFTRKEARSSLPGSVISRDRLSVASFRLDYDLVDTRYGGLNFVYLEYTHGIPNFLGSLRTSEQETADTSGVRSSRQGADGVLAGGDFRRVNLGFTRLQTLTENTSLLMRAEFQWSTDLLVPLEQFSIGGPDNVRGYPVAEVLWDTGVLLSLEYLVNAPFIGEQVAFGNRTWGELMQLSFFVDQATGRINRPIELQQQAGHLTYRSVGTGLRFNLPGTVSARAMAAWELNDRPECDQARTSRCENPDNRFPQAWLELSYKF